MAVVGSVLDVNLHALDEEWVRQPRLYHKWARKLADARDGLARASSNLDIVTAEVARAVRANPQKFDIPGRPTKDVVDNRVTLHKRVKLAVSTVNDAKHKVNVYEAMVKALDHKKSALERLVTLQGQDYFSGHMSVPAEAGKKVRRRMEEAEKDRAFGKRKRGPK